MQHLKKGNTLKRCIFLLSSQSCYWSHRHWIIEPSLAFLLYLPSFISCAALPLNTSGLSLSKCQIQPLTFLLLRGLAVRSWSSSCCLSGQTEPRGGRWPYSPERWPARWPCCRGGKFHELVWAMFNVRIVYACCAYTANFTLGTVMMTWCESYSLLVCGNTSDTTVNVRLNFIYPEIWEKGDRTQWRQRRKRLYEDGQEGFKNLTVLELLQLQQPGRISKAK